MPAHGIRLSALLLIGWAVAACGTPDRTTPDATPTPAEAPAEDPAETPAEVTPTAPARAEDVTFELESLGTRFDAPYSAIWLVVDGQRHFVDDAMGASLAPARGTPASAAASMSAWWGGGGPLFYAEVEEGAVRVYRRFEEEMVAADSTDWELIHTFDSEAPSALEAGSYCFSSDDGVTSIRMSFTLEADGSVTGEGSTLIEDHDEGYFTSAQTTFSGAYRDGVLIVDARDEIEYDVQEYRGAWPASKTELIADGRPLTPCGAGDGARGDAGTGGTDGAAGPDADGDGPGPIAGSLCTPAEDVYFSCPVEGSAEVLSLCASADLTADAGYLQFRRGTPGAVSTQIPAEPLPPGDRFLWEPIMYSGGWDTRVQFIQESTEYQLYDRAIKVSMEERDFSAGVLMIRDGVEEDLQCSAEVFEDDGAILLNHLADILPRGEFIDL